MEELDVYVSEKWVRYEIPLTNTEVLNKVLYYSIVDTYFNTSDDKKRKYKTQQLGPLSFFQFSVQSVSHRKDKKKVNFPRIQFICQSYHTLEGLVQAHHHTTTMSRRHHHHLITQKPDLWKVMKNNLHFKCQNYFFVAQHYITVHIIYSLWSTIHNNLSDLLICWSNGLNHITFRAKIKSPQQTLT